MVDTRDLKSLGHYGCMGSSPISGTRLPAVPAAFAFYRTRVAAAKFNTI